MSRFITILREIAVAYTEKTVLVTSHMGLMRTFLVHLGFESYKELFLYNFLNTAYIKIKSDGVDFFIEELYGVEKK